MHKMARLEILHHCLFITDANLYQLEVYRISFLSLYDRIRLFGILQRGLLTTAANL